MKTLLVVILTFTLFLFSCGDSGFQANGNFIPPEECPTPQPTSTPEQYCKADLNFDGKVDHKDFKVFKENAKDCGYDDHDDDDRILD